MERAPTTSRFWGCPPCTCSAVGAPEKGKAIRREVEQPEYMTKGSGVRIPRPPFLCLKLSQSVSK